MQVAEVLGEFRVDGCQGFWKESWPVFLGEAPWIWMKFHKQVSPQFLTKLTQPGPMLGVRSWPNTILYPGK